MSRYKISRNYKSMTKISSFVLFILAYAIIITGSTYAYLQLNATNNNVTAQAGCFEVNYQGEEINHTNLSTTTNYLEGARSTITLSKHNNCPVYTDANIYIHVDNDITAPIATTQALKYKIVQGNKDISEGFITEKGEVLLTNVPLTTTATTYTVYIWVDSSLSNKQYDNVTFTGYLYATSDQTSTIPQATFLNGEEFNVKIKQLANPGVSDITRDYEDTQITSIKRSDTLSITPTDANIISTSDSPIPIYAWFDNGTLYYYTTCLKPSLNELSHTMFVNFKSVKTIDLYSIDTSNVGGEYGMNAMFYNDSSLISLDLSSFDTSNVDNISWMFYKCTNLVSLNVSSFDTSKVTTMAGLFFGCENLKRLDLNNFDTKNVTDMTSMFRYCYKLESLDISSFNTSKVTIMRLMFSQCQSLKTLDLSNFNTSNVTSMVQMFYDCHSLTSLDLSSFNTISVTDMNGMFYLCYGLTSLDVSSFNTSKVTDMKWMFSYCESLTSLNLSNFNTTAVKSVEYMFYDCIYLTTIYVSNLWDLSGATTSTRMFHLASSLVGGNGTTYNSSYLDKTYAVVDTASTPGYLTLKTS